MGCVRVEERVLAAFGGLVEAPTRFERGRDVSCGGVLWALPALLANGLLHRQAECFELPKGFYGVVQVLLLMGFLALARIKSLERLRFEAPGEWGQLLGLDRIPEVHTLRTKLGLMAQGQKVEANWRSATRSGAPAEASKADALTILSCRESPSWPTIRWNVSSRYDYFPLCNTQHGYSPQRRGRSVRRATAIRGIHPQRRTAGHPLLWGEGRGEGE
jgi:hypothetical protein